MRRLLKTLRADFAPGAERGAMMRSAGRTAGFKIVAMLIAFGASLVFAQALMWYWLRRRLHIRSSAFGI